MRQIEANLLAHLKSGATTLCHCWKITRRDAETLRLTDHDCELIVDNQNYSPLAGASATADTRTKAFAVGGMEMESSLRIEGISQQAIENGQFDNAKIEVWLVNWQSPDQKLLLRAGNLGEIRRVGDVFSAEIRALSHELNQTIGRVLSKNCNAELGDSRCGVDVEQSQLQTQGSVAQILSPTLYVVSGISGFPSQWFNRGVLLWLSGNNNGLAYEIKKHELSAQQILLEIWQPVSQPVQVGDRMQLTVGCDKSFVTCKQKFQNAQNFRGFPHIPGKDFVLGYPDRNTGVNSGSKLVD